MRGLTGLNALAQNRILYDDSSEASPQERSGDVVNPRHAKPNPSVRYPWQSRATQAADTVAPQGLANQLLGDEMWFFEPGGFPDQDYRMDYTPTSHGGPRTRGIASGPVPGVGPDDITEQLRQSLALHAIRTNAGTNRLTQLPPANDEWNELHLTNPGHTDLVPLGSRQAMSSGFMYGSRDATHSFARQNEYGFDSAHMHRRWASSSIPGNTMWMRPGGRLLMKTLAGPAKPAVGLDSPFTGQDLGTPFGVNGAVLQSVPTEYVPPPSPELANDTIYDAPASIEWY